MRKVFYLCFNGRQIVPVYKGREPAGFDIVDIVTGEVLEHCKMLGEAEDLLDRWTQRR